jgi:hypothetical protein
MFGAKLAVGAKNPLESLISMMLPVHDSLRPSEPPLSISREQAAKIIHHHFTEHRNSDVQLEHIPGAYHRYAD